MDARRTVRATVAIALGLALAAGTALAEGRVLGVVTDMNGERLPKELPVTLKLIPLDTSKTVQEIRPNKKGKFAFGLVPQGEWRLVAFAEGMRIARIDANIAVPDDDSIWAVAEDVPPGAELPSFAVTGVSTVSYDIAFAPYDKDPGEYGTGLPVSPIKVILEAIQEDRLDEAIADIEQNLEAAPDDPTLHYLAAFAHRLGGNLDRALEAIDASLGIDPTFEGGSLLKGKILADSGRKEEALSLYQGEATLAANDQVRRDALLEQALVLQDLGRDGEAVTALEQLIEVAPELTAAYGDLAALYLKTGQTDKAKAMTEKVMELGGSNPDMLYNLGVERFNNNDFEAAAEYFYKVVELAPDYPDAHLQLGFCQLNLGEQGLAVEHLKRFLDVAPADHGGVGTAQAIVQQLAGS